MSMLFRIIFFWLPSKKVEAPKPTPKPPARSERSKRTRKKK
tara:strand:- start:1172 stop:1294 length:123 start_codon:yes stop_codon:yes gene_type:complete